MRRLLLLTLLAACGDPDGPLRIKGTVFEPQSRFYAATSNGNARGLALFLSDQPGLCAAWREGAYPAASSIVQVNFYRGEAGNSVDVDLGEYGVFNTGSGAQATGQVTASGRFVVAQAGAYTSACKAAQELSTGLKGTVRLTGLEPMTGEYDLRFGNGVLAGELDAPFCDVAPSQFCPHR